jgi:cytochrome c peroxidase
MSRRLLIATVAIVFAISFAIAAAKSGGGVASPEEQLGELIFFDETLSLNANQSCASCHAPSAGWTGPQAAINAHGAVYEGSVAGAFGARKPPSAAYATVSPIFHMEKRELFVGGNFWDGRATGENLGNPAADQAQGPFLNPAEQALYQAADVVSRVCAGSYAALFVQVWGSSACDPANVDAAFDAIARSIAAYEHSSAVNRFTSRVDGSATGGDKLTREERKGQALFQAKARCRLCHTSHGQNPLFTDFTFDNLGLPRNPENPVYAYNPGFVDYGLGGFLATRPAYADLAEDNLGRHKVPTLRNVDLRPAPTFVKAYGHNGYFKSLWGIVHFYNTRDVLPTCAGDYTEAQALAANCWPPPEVAVNVNRSELGNLGLTREEEDAIVAFLKALSDRPIP